MKLSHDQLVQSLKQNCESFSSNTKKNIQQYLGTKIESEKGSILKFSEVTKENDVHFSILFNGSVYGEFILSMNKKIASELVMEKSDDFEENIDEIFDCFKEILNISVGKTLDSLGEEFEHLSITSPRVQIGQIYLPQLPIYTQKLETSHGPISCSLYIDQMKLNLATEYKSKANELDQAKIEKEQLKLLNKTKTEFLANMSHELRTPLNGMIGYLDLLKKTPLSSIQKRQIDTVAQSGDFLLGIINDILDFSKIEAGRLEIENKEASLPEVMDHFVEMVCNQIYLKGLDFEVNLDPSLPEKIQTDVTRLRQVLTNLVGNALKFTPTGKISLSVDKKDEFIEFAVRDTGIGIPNDRLRTIFQSFSQADLSDNRKYGGTGLGLTISKSIVEAFGGEIHVESEEAKGSQFTFKIPFNSVIENTVSDLYIGKEFKKKPRVAISSTGISKSLEFYFKNYLSLQMEEFDDSMEFSKQSAYICDWKFIENLSDSKRTDFFGQIKDKKAYLNILYTNSDLMAISSHADELDGLSGELIRCPLTPVQIKQITNQDKVMSFKEEKEVNKTDKKEPKSELKVLLVEDNMINQQISTSMLELIGLKVDIANNGQEAFESCQKNTYDLIFMDCQMPVKDGYEATKMIREEENLNQNTKIIALTANAFREIKEKCFECGMDDFTTKPVKQEDLAEVVKKYTG